ncbi:alpha/beta hydrolase family esterase [Streptomyces sp. NPDC048182]|uniref:alpha/beta hydrolase family esterase n=1 Tax=Streptomyces sp. NPDC048182 TaxID=3365507 RepID=UPI00371CD369
MRTSHSPHPHRTRTGVLAALALALMVLTGCGSTDTGRDTDRPTAAPAPSSAHATEPAATTAYLRVDGIDRTYHLHRPPTAPDGPRPLIVAFHGRNSDAAELREQTRLERAAGKRGMLVAYPEGLDHGWGAGTRKTPQRPDPARDVRFAEALVAHLVRTERADPRRVYAAGFSNGGSMALRLAADRPRLLAGAASVSGQLPTGADAVRPTGRVPVLIVYGADDPVRPLAGLPSPPPDPKEPIVPTMSARASAQAFAAAGEAGPPRTSPERGYDRTTWRLPGTPAGTVQLLVVHDAGHTWPGSAMTPPEGFGRTSRALDATTTLLDFFTR